MSRNIIDDTPHIWGTRSSTDSSTVEHDYDRFARSGSYDATFDEWGYGDRIGVQYFVYEVL